jgi:hypothetical protein
MDIGNAARLVEQIMTGIPIGRICGDLTRLLNLPVFPYTIMIRTLIPKYNKD